MNQASRAFTGKGTDVRVNGQRMSLVFRVFLGKYIEISAYLQPLCPAQRLAVTSIQEHSPCCVKITLPDKTIYEWPGIVFEGGAMIKADDVCTLQVKFPAFPSLSEPVLKVTNCDSPEVGNVVCEEFIQSPLEPARKGEK